MTTTTPEDVTTLTRTELARTIDHTRLTFGPDEDQVEAVKTLCREAAESGFYAVCVRPEHVTPAKEALAGTGVKVATVIGFPATKLDLAAEKQTPTVGGFTTDEKLAETRQVLSEQADELDVVLNVSLFKREGEDKPETIRELSAIREVAGNTPIKLIVESDLLTDVEIERAVQLCFETRMEMIKTSTGMVTGGVGAAYDTVALMRRAIDKLAASGRFDWTPGIKASGGVRATEQAVRLVRELGVDRIGTSSGILLVQGLNS